MSVQDKRGFTLIEIMVALAIVLFAVLGFSAAILTMIRSNKTSENYTIATTLGQDKMEELRADTAAGLALTSGSAQVSSTGEVIPGGGNPREGFDLAWTIPDPDVTGLPAEMTSILVEVKWDDSEGQTQLVALHTVIEGDAGGGGGVVVGSGDDNDD